MVVFAAAALVASIPQSAPVGVAVQATATVRIVSAVRLRLDAPSNPGAPPARECVVRTSDGTIERAKLIEFQ
jgi:hypothetical protein